MRAYRCVVTIVECPRICGSAARLPPRSAHRVANVCRNRCAWKPSTPDSFWIVFANAPALRPLVSHPSDTLLDLNEKVRREWNPPHPARLGLRDDQAAVLHVVGPCTDQLPPPEASAKKQPNDESVWLRHVEDLLDLLVAQPIRWSFLDTGQQPPWDWRHEGTLSRSEGHPGQAMALLHRPRGTPQPAPVVPRTRRRPGKLFPGRRDLLHQAADWAPAAGASPDPGMSLRDPVLALSAR